MMLIPLSWHSGSSSSSPDWVQQGVAAGQQEAVEVALPGELGQRLPVVHPRADRLDHALGPQLVQGRVGLVDRLLVVIVGVVDQQDVHVVRIQPFEALLQRAEHTVPAVVEPPVEGKRLHPSAVLHRLVYRVEHPANLRREDEAAPIDAGEGLSEEHLALADAVQRRRVEVADPQPARQLHRLQGGVLGDLAGVAPEGGASHAQLGDLQARAADLHQVQGVHRISPRKPRLRPLPLYSSHHPKGSCSDLRETSSPC